MELEEAWERITHQVPTHCPIDKNNPKGCYACSENREAMKTVREALGPYMPGLLKPRGTWRNEKYIIKNEGNGFVVYELDIQKKKSNKWVGSFKDPVVAVNFANWHLNNDRKFGKALLGCADIKNTFREAGVNKFPHESI